MMTNLLHGAHVANKLFSTIARLRLLLVMFLTLSVTTNAWGAEKIVYTLTPAEGSNNSYAGNCDIVIDGVTWNLTGNSQEQPWRIGGKSITEEDRALYSKTPISNNISKIIIEHGTASSITVNSVKLFVSTQENGTGTVISELSNSFTASSTMTFTRPDGKDWTNAYYKIVYNVTVSSSKNKYLEFTNALFYSAGGNTPEPIDPEITFSDGEYTVGGAALNLSTLLTTNSTGAVTYSVTNAGSTGATINGTSFTATTAGQCTVQASQAETASHNAITKTATITVTAPAGGGGSDDCDNPTWQLVTNVSDLAVGDEIVIAASNANYALSTTQRSSNRQAVAITKSDDAITINENVQVITLATASATKTNTFAFYVGTGFLYASSSGSNELKTTANPGQNGDWYLEIKNTGVASITAQGDKTRKVMQFNLNNNNPAIFACYSSASQTSLAIYKKVCSIQPTVYLIPKCGCDGGGTWLVVIEWFATF